MVFPIVSYSQFGEDVEILALYPKSHKGFFVDVGANDGIRDSNTYLLEKNGWSGILIEANPELATKAGVRSNSIIVTAAVGAVDSNEVRFLKVSQEGSNLDGLSSLSLAPETIERIYCHGGEITEIMVPQLTLNTILKRNIVAPGKIDVLSIDIEGNEFDALSGFDLEKYRPDFILIEDNSRGGDPAVPGLLKQRGYKRVHRTGWNDWYIPTSSSHSFVLKRLALMLRLLKWRFQRIIRRSYGDV